MTPRDARVTSGRGANDQVLMDDSILRFLPFLALPCMMPWHAFDGPNFNTFLSHPFFPPASEGHTAHLLVCILASSSFFCPHAGCS
jgi:hypothetical protein